MVRRYFGRSLINMLIFFVIFSASPLCADQNEAQLQALGLKNSTLRIIKKIIMPEFMKHIPKKEYKFKILFWGNFNAAADVKSCEVLLPLGFLVGLDYLVTANVIAYLRPDLKPQLPKYIEYYFATYAKNFQAGREVIPTMGFFPFCNVPMHEAKITTDKDVFRNLSFFVYVQDLALIIGHELGHIILNHSYNKNKPYSTLRQEEMDADMFAVDLMDKSGFDVLPGAFTAYTYFSLFEDDQAKRTHPHADCRVYRIVYEKFKSLSVDEKFCDVNKGLYDINTLLNQIKSFEKSCKEDDIH